MTFAPTGEGQGQPWAVPAGSLPQEFATADGPIGFHEVEQLALASLKDASTTATCVSAWLRGACPIEEIYLHGITGAARLLGQWWVSDRISFSDVTVGASRLHRMLYELSPVFLADAEPPQDATVLLLAEPGSQHTMGLFMLSEFFRRAGWRTLLEQPTSASDTMRTVSSHWLDVVTLSVSSDRHWDALQTLVRQLRHHSSNPDLQIIAGGPMALLNEAALLDLGVDWIGTDAKATVWRARQEMQRPPNS